MVFIDVHAGLLLALEGDAGTGGLCQAVDIVSFDAQTLFDAAAHLLRPGLCAEDACLELIVLRLVAAVCQGFAQIGSIGGRAAQDRRVQVHHELELTLGVSGGHGKRKAPDFVGAAVEAGAAGEEAVAVGDLHDVFICSAGSDDRPCAALLPHVQVLLGIEGHNALSGGAGSGLNADAVLEIRAQKAVGIGFAEIVFGEERKFLDVVNALYVFRLYTFLVHQIAVVGDIVVDVFHLLYDLLVLDLQDLLAGRGLDLFLVIVLHFEAPFLAFVGIAVIFRRRRALGTSGPDLRCADDNKKGAAPVEVPHLCERSVNL